MKRIRASQAGDTIVEVLLAVAVLSSTLAVAYATMNRNLARLQDNQERTESSKLAQGQIEALIGLWRTDREQVTNEANSGFCINSLSVSTLPISVPAADGSSENPGDYTGAGCSSTFYRYAVQRIADDSTTSTYRIYVRWESAGSGTPNEVVYAHKLSKDTP